MRNIFNGRINRIYNLYWRNVGWRISNLVVIVKNLKRWFPVIVRDRDWDHHYIWEIVKTKLKHQSEYIAKNGNHLDAKYDASRMMTCVKLIEKLQNGLYDSEHMSFAETELNWLDATDKPGFKQLEIKEISERYDEYFAKYKSSVRKVLKDDAFQNFKLTGELDKSLLATKVARYNEKKAQDLLFKIINRHINSWWD
jgi:hypothetical protein